MVVCVIFLALSVALFYANAASVHGCAPVVPPAVAGTLEQPPAEENLLFINEVLLAPHTEWACPSATSPAVDNWIELYNPQNQAFDLYTAHMSFDNGPNTPLFYFPFGSAIAAHGFLVLFPAVSTVPILPETGPLTLRLLLSGTVIDQVVVPPLAVDTSYARVPDGSVNWQVSNAPTIAASNDPPQATATSSTRTKVKVKSTKKGGTGNTNNGVNSAPGSVVRGTTSTGTAGSATPGNRTAVPWTRLQFPTQMPSATDSTVSQMPPVADDQPVTPAQNGVETDLPRDVLLTGLVIGLALVLLWCKRRFLR